LAYFGRFQLFIRPRAKALATHIEPPIRAELHVQTICLSALTVVAVGFALWWLQPVMIPFVVAAFLAFALMPLVDGLEVHARLSRTLAVCVALLLALLVLVAVGALTSTAVVQITSNASQYEEQLGTLIDEVAQWPALRWLGLKPAERLTHAEVAKTQQMTPRAAVPSAAERENANQAEENTIPAGGTNPFQLIPQSAVQSFLLGATNAVLSIVKQSVIVLVFLFFLLLSSVKRDRPIGGAWGEMEGRIRAYIITMTTLSGVTGMLVGAVLSMFGVQAAVLFGLLTFLLNFIPNVGSFISILLPIPIIWLSPDLSLLAKLLAILIPAVIQFFIGNFIQPKLMGEHMKLHPVTILISLIFWGMLWGIVGAFLAVPITSIIRIACDRHPLTKPVADLMAGRLDNLREEPVVIAEVSAQG
jgi:AI-2 transport protein TqsA